jgi:c-di-GMP-binding flagellar brake protein YcgR
MIKKLWEGLKSLRRGDGNGRWDFGERRELVRMRCDLEISYTVGSRRYFGHIVDMSLGGMLLRCSQPPTMASITDVTYKVPLAGVKEDTVRCRVQWVKRRRKDQIHFVGLSYYSSEEVLRNSWVKASLRELGFRPERLFRKRKFVRVNCFIPVRLLSGSPSTRPVEGRLYNLGAKGALLEADAPVARGETVRLTIGPHEQLDAFEVKARVVGCEEINRLQFLGVEFENLTSRCHASVGVYLRSLLDDGGGES